MFQAVDLTSGKTVAVKLVDGASDVERFLHEAEVLAQLDHPAIVKYVAHGQSDHESRVASLEVAFRPLARRRSWSASRARSPTRMIAPCFIMT